jgi:hypothetical protein
VTVYARPGAEGSLRTFPSRYVDCIGGEWVAPAAGRYFENARAAVPRVGQYVAAGAGADSEQDRSPHRLPGPCAPGAHVCPEQVRTHGVDYESVDNDCLEKR